MSELKNDLYDLSMLYEQVGNDNASLKRFVDIFQTTAPDDMQNLKDAIDWEDFDKARAASHKMKSSFLIMGAGWAHDICAAMETIAKSRIETEKLPDLYWELSDKFDKMVTNLKLLTF